MGGFRVKGRGGLRRNVLRVRGVFIGLGVVLGVGFVLGLGVDLGVWGFRGRVG